MESRTQTLSDSFGPGDTDVVTSSEEMRQLLKHAHRAANPQSLQATMELKRIKR